MEKEDSEFVDTLKDEIRKRGAMGMRSQVNVHSAQDNMGYACMGMNVNEEEESDYECEYTYTYKEDMNNGRRPDGW